jgi:hypothetical protein
MKYIIDNFIKIWCELKEEGAHVRSHLTIFKFWQKGLAPKEKPLSGAKVHILSAFWCKSLMEIQNQFPVDGDLSSKKVSLKRVDIPVQYEGLRLTLYHNVAHNINLSSLLAIFHSFLDRWGGSIRKIF